MNRPRTVLRNATKAEATGDSKEKDWETEAGQWEGLAWSWGHEAHHRQVTAS